jgi:Uma2 family endonuclease
LATTKLVTIEDLMQIEDENHRYDLIDGVLYRSQLGGEAYGLVGGLLFALVGIHVRDNSLGEMLLNGGCIFSRDPDTVLAPDGAFIQTARVPKVISHTEYCKTIPDLAFEIVQAADDPALIRKKIDVYQRSHVGVSREVSLERRAVIVHYPGQPPITIPEMAC